MGIKGVGDHSGSPLGNGVQAEVQDEKTCAESAVSVSP